MSRHRIPNPQPPFRFEYVRKSANYTVSPAERQTMVDLYQQGKNIVEIGKMLDRSFFCVSRHLKLANIQCRDPRISRKRYTVKNDYFESIDTPTKAYLLGMIYADGNIFDNRRFKLALWDIDEPFLVETAKELDFNGPIYKEHKKGKGHDMRSLTIYGETFVNHLKNKGVIENKTNRLTFPTFIEPNLIVHFIHGLLDGDGCITLFYRKKEPYQKVMFAGCYIVMKGVYDWFISQGIQGQISRNKKNTLSGSVSYGAVKALRVANILYDHHQPLCLSRKKDKYYQMVKRFEERRRYKRSKTIPHINKGLEIIQRYS